MSDKYLNIRYPFQDSAEGFFVELNKTTKDAVKSDLLHLLLTNKGSRYYLPDFGTNLRRYIFQPNDAPTHNEIISEIQIAVDTYLPGLKIVNIGITVDPNNENAAIVNVKFSVTQGVFEETDFIEFSLSQ
jgi:phage baseplate assembly protein W